MDIVLVVDGVAMIMTDGLVANQAICASVKISNCETETYLCRLSHLRSNLLFVVIRPLPHVLRYIRDNIRQIVCNVFDVQKLSF